jgi:dienelactone hydrolase
MSYLWYWPHGGWSFDAWRSTRMAPVVASAQSGRSELVPLLASGDDLPAWQAKRGQWKSVSDGILGTLTDRPPTEMRYEPLGDAYEARHEGCAYRARRIRYTLTDREWGFAWLLTPSGSGPFPAVIALHQTGPLGKHGPVGLDAEHPFGLDLVTQGFVVFAPDAICFGERQAAHLNAAYKDADQFFATHPDGSVMAKMAFDTSRAVDLLQSLPEVDPGAIGCAGNSHGGYGTLFAMVADDRIRAGVISCGMAVLRDDVTPQRWWRKTALLPNLGFYEGCIADCPIDFQVWIALVAPRPLLISYALSDECFPQVGAVAQAAELGREVYALYGAADGLELHAFDDVHQFHPEARRRGYALFRQALLGGPPEASDGRPGHSCQANARKTAQSA